MFTDEELAAIRASWEGGLVPLSVIDQRKQTSAVLVILCSPDDETINKNRMYHCHRYFKVVNEAVCSVDGQYVRLEAVFSWLNDPCVQTTRRLVKHDRVPMPVES